jgi:hypothetical protein
MEKLTEIISGIMPAFLENMVLRGFWWACLASIIISIPIGILGWIFGKINKVLGAIIQYIPYTLFYFYVWRTRPNHGAWWLICAISSILGFIFIIFQRKGRITDKTLAIEIAAEAARSNLPVMLDDGLRFDSMTTLPGKKILYTFTATTIDPGLVFTPETVSYLRTKNLTNINNEALDRYRKNKVTFVYRYMDRERQGQVGYIEITPSDYR